MGVIDRLNKAIKVLINKDEVSTTEVGVDRSYLEGQYRDIITVDNSRKGKYLDYINMDDVYGAEISSTLDAIADSLLRRDDMSSPLIRITQGPLDIVNFIRNMLYNLNVQDVLWTWARSLSKFGDLFVEIIWSTDEKEKKLSNVVGLKSLPTETMFLNIGNDGKIDKEYPYRQEIDGTIIARFKLWQIIHFILQREPTDDYGTSWLKAARIPYKNLNAMENALAISRLEKSLTRLHKIDITGKTIPLAKQAVEDYKKQFNFKTWINPNGQIGRHKQTFMVNDDIYMGVTDGGGKYAGIEYLEGKSEVVIKDIEYFRTKLLGALKTPKHLFNIDSPGKATSVSQGLYFSASIQRLQLCLLKGLYYLIDLALIVNKFNLDSKKKDYELALPNQRTVDELIAARVSLIRSTVAKNYTEMGIISKDFIMRYILGFEPDFIEDIKKSELDDIKGDDVVNKDSKEKVGSNFNKTGMGSAPIRKPSKESVEMIKKDCRIEEIINDIQELMKNKRIENNDKFGMDYIKREILKDVK